MQQTLSLLRNRKFMMMTMIVAVFMAMGSPSYAAMSLDEPTMPDSSGIFQKMIDVFGTAAIIGLAIIGAAVALGLLVVLAMWGWRLLKKWLSSAK